MSTAAQWTVIAGLFVATFATKAIGPVALGGRPLPARATGVITVMPAALLAALVVVGALTGRDGGIVVGAEAAGVLLAMAIAWRRHSILLAVLAAAALTAGLRLL